MWSLRPLKNLEWNTQFYIFQSLNGAFEKHLTHNKYNTIIRFPLFLESLAARDFFFSKNNEKLFRVVHPFRH